MKNILLKIFISFVISHSPLTNSAEQAEANNNARSLRVAKILEGFQRPSTDMNLSVENIKDFQIYLNKLSLHDQVDIEEEGIAQIELLLQKIYRQNGEASDSRFFHGTATAGHATSAVVSIVAIHKILKHLKPSGATKFIYWGAVFQTIYSVPSFSIHGTRYVKASNEVSLTNEQINEVKKILATQKMNLKIKKEILNIK